MKRMFSILLISGGLSLSVSAAPLLLNGDFETGTLTGWTAGVMAEEPVEGGFEAATGTMSSHSFMDTVGARAGTTYALADVTGPSTSYLYQSFLTPLNMISVSFDFSLFVLDGGLSGAINPGNLLTTAPNQHARVDILRAGSDPLSTAPVDVVRSFFAGTHTTQMPALYVNYSFDLSTDLAPGTTYILRFAQATTEGPLLTGVDDVSIEAISAQNPVVPEPSTFLLAVPAGALLLLLRRKRA